MRTPGISLLVLYCTDFDGCHRFYANLGLDFTQERHGQGPEHWAAILADGVVLELYPAISGRTTGTLRLGLTVATGSVGLTPGQHLLDDPDGRTVSIDVR